MAAKSDSILRREPGRSVGKLGGIKKSTVILGGPSIFHLCRVGFPFVRLVLGEACLSQPFGQGLVAVVIEDREREAHVEVERARMPMLGSADFRLVDQKRRDEAADDHGLIGEVPQLRRNVEAGRANDLDLSDGVARGSVRLVCHHAFQFRSRLRSSVAASSARSGWPFRSRYACTG